MIDVYRDLCASAGAAFRASEVWLAPHSMADQLATHPLVNQDYVLIDTLEDIAPARDGFVYFPRPIRLNDLHPMYGLAWHMQLTGEDLAFSAETITDTRLIPTRLPPQLANSIRLPLAPYCPNSLTTHVYGKLVSYGNPDPFGAPDAATVLALVLAFWDLRAPMARNAEDPGDPSEDEDTVSVVQQDGPLPGTKKSAHGRKNKRSTQSGPKRRIRVIRESPYLPARAPDTREDGPAATEAGAMAPEPIPQPSWKDETLRWEVSMKFQNRCPNPHQHRAIIEAGGECKPTKVPVKAHFNGPKGRDVDPRRTVRIVPDRS
ncbi:hypothetical protein OG458_42225 (plasmid) [Streptomyces sp. NBC_01281]|uniref:hypothetical protein n=1 Tax=Streptomyces sp. NBC_01281 TaxID=2903811 RepID=UPI002E11B795|nr:hypothetical protein OG458_42225 [Streptomyces sp. NBC_01281]